MDPTPPPAYTPRNTSTFRTVHEARANLSSIPRSSTAPASSTAASTEAEAELYRPMFLFQLLALLVCTLAVKFTLSVVKVLLDCLMCVLALVCVLAILRPGPKNGPVSIVLGYIEAFVDPAYHWMAERVSRIASGPILKLFLFLKRNNNPRGPAPAAR
ncbi:hypothetical protein GGF40_003065 [Coemansia sp. RSA 1286]|nr:hypothetical protein IWW45_001438 [Coemansia sp. RSA 485]KAJ2636325.1 hypothetical protein GGF40_003065 [Coemansia sp. RSA 1286]